MYFEKTDFNNEAILSTIKEECLESSTNLPKNLIPDSDISQNPFKQHSILDLKGLGLRKDSLRESDNQYNGVVLYLSDRWRVIVCKNNKQWILQYRSSLTDLNTWQAKSYCTQRTSLERCIKQKTGKELTLSNLPEHIS